MKTGFLGIELFRTNHEDGEWTFFDPTHKGTTFSGYATEDEAIEDYMLNFGLPLDALKSIKSIQAENDRLNAEATSDAELIKRLNASLAEALAERDGERETRRKAWNKIDELLVVQDRLTEALMRIDRHFRDCPRPDGSHAGYYADIARKALEGEGK